MYRKFTTDSGGEDQIYRPQSGGLATLLVIATTAIAVLLRIMFDLFVGPAPAFLIPFFLPVVVTSLYFGARWGSLATVLNFAIVAFFFTPPVYSFAITTLEDQVRVGTFVVLSGVLSVLTGNLSHYRQRAEDDAKAKARRQEELEREVEARRGAERLLEKRAAERTAEIDAQRRLLDAVFNALPVAVIIADPTGKFVRINRACYEVCGDVPNASGVEDFRAWIGYWPNTGRRVEPMEWPLSRAVFASESCSDEIIVERFGDQVRRTLQISAAPVFGMDGLVIAGVITVVDVTEQKLVIEAQRELEQKFRAVFHSQSQLIGLVSPEGVLLDANRTALAAAGLKEDSVLGKPFWETAWWTHDPVQQERLRAAVASAAAGVADRFEASCPRADGTIMWVDFSLTPYYHDGNVVLLIPEGRDITIQKETERTLAANKALLQQFIKYSPAAIAMFDREVRYVQTSDRWLTDYQLGGRDIIGLSHYEVFPDIPDAWKAVHKRALAGAIEKCDEDPFHRADGTTEWLQWECQPWHDSTGEVGGLIMFTQVITKRKRDEAALRESNVRFRGAMEGSLDSVFFLTAERDPLGTVTDFRFTELNQRGSELLNRTREQVVGHRLCEILPANRTHGLFDKYVRVLDTGEPLEEEFRLDASDGLNASWLRHQVIRVGDGVTITTQDITARKGIEAALLLSEARFRMLAGDAPVGIFETDVDGNCLFVNSRWCGLAGMTRDAAMGQGWVAALHSDDRDRVFREWSSATEKRCEFLSEYRFQTASGKVTWLSGSAVALRDATGGVVGFIGTVMDINARKMAEAELRLSEERFRRLVDGVSNHAIFMLDTTGHIVSWNPAAKRINGYSSDEIIGQHFSVFYMPADVFSGHPQKELAMALAEGRCQEEGQRVRKDGSHFWAEVTISSLCDDTGQHVGFVMFAHDISERKRSEEMIRASLEEKEVMLKEIHHRVKNNLQIVSALLELQSAHTSDKTVVEMFEESQGRVKSMALIHERLYKSGNFAGVNFGEYVRQLAEDLYRTYKVTDGDIELKLDVDIPLVPIDIAIPCGLLLNELISNCLKHAFQDTTSGCILVSLLIDGIVTVLSVSDDGAGFTPNVDFHNTTSFGLQLVNTLVEQLDGEVELSTSPKTTITVRFPKPKT